MANKQFKIGQKVRWTSQAGGSYTPKEGTIIASCRPNEMVKLSQTTAVNILREVNPNVTVARAKKMAETFPVWHILSKKYRLKFDYGLNTAHEEPHYLVEVDQGEGRKPHLYHPLTRNLTPAS